MLKVVGVGILKGDVTERGKAAISKADRVFSRVKLSFATEVLDKYEAADYLELDKLIADEVNAAAKTQNVVYCALGDGYTDSAVTLMLADEIIPGVAEHRGRTPASAVTFMSAYEISADTIIDTTRPLMVYGIDDKLIAGALKLHLIDAYGDETELTFSSGSSSLTIPLYELDRQKTYKGACAYFEGNVKLIDKPRYGISDLINVMTRLTDEDGCPWDKAQTHESIRINLIEEAYEAVDAIDSGDVDNLREEVGDVLLQAVFHCNIAQRTGEFTFNDAVSELVHKLVTRHTHIFGENRATDEESALKFWEQAKAKEKSYNSLSGQLDRLPEGFPALLKAEKAYKKSVKSGANLPPEIIKDKLVALIGEGVTEQNAGRMLLLACALTAAAHADGEVELNKAAGKFISDMKELEQCGNLGEADKKL